MRRLLAVPLLLAACSRAPEREFSVELAYGEKGYLLLTEKSPEGEETYGLRLADSYFYPETAATDWQVFWGDQPPRFAGKPEPAGVIRVRKDPFVLRFVDGALHAARVAHRVERDGKELFLKRVRDGKDGGAPWLDYGPKDAGPGEPAHSERAQGFVRVKGARFRLPSKILM